MAQDLIRHTSKEKIVPGPLVSQDAAFAGLENLTNKLADKSRQFADQQALRVAEEQGALAGEDPTFTPRPGFTKALQVFNKAGLQTNKYTTATEVDNKLTEFFDEAKQNVSDTSILDFSARLQGFTKGTLENTPSANHAYVKNLINYKGGKAFQRLNGMLFERNKAVLASQFDESFISLENQMSNAGREGDFNAAHSFHGQLQNMMKEGLTQGLLTPGQFRAYSTQADKILNRENALGQFMQSVDAGEGAEFIKNFQKSKESKREFSAIEKDALVKRMGGILKEQALNNGIIQDGFANTMKTQVIRARGGVETSPEQVGVLFEAFPKRASEIQGALDLAHSFHEELQAATYLTNGEMQERIQQLGGNLTEEELKAPHPQQIIAHRNSLANELTSMLDTRQKDPFLYVESTPLYQQEVDKQNQGLPSDTQGVALRLQKQVGIPDDQRRLISKAVAAETQSSVLALPLDQGVAQLEQMKLEAGQNWKYIAPSILTKDFPTKYPLLMGVINNPQSRPYKDEIVAALNTPEKVYKDVRKSTKDDITNRINSIMIPFKSTTDAYPANSLEVTNGITSNIRRTALWYTQNSNFNLSPKNAVARAYQVLVKNRYSEINNGSYRVPFDIDPSEVRRMVRIKDKQTRVLWEQGKIAPFRDTSLVENPIIKAQAQEQDRREILNQGTWVTNGANENQLLYMSPRGVPVTLKNGKPLMIDLRNLTFFDEDLLEFKEQIEEEEKEKKTFTGALKEEGRLAAKILLGG